LAVGGRQDQDQGLQLGDRRLDPYGRHQVPLELELVNSSGVAFDLVPDGQPLAAVLAARTTQKVLKGSKEAEFGGTEPK
jgi:hypothetical protein